MPWKRRKKRQKESNTGHGGSHARDAAMVSRLRRQFVTTAMISLLIIVLLMIAVINIANFAQIDSSAAEMLDILAANGGEFPSQKDTSSDSEEEEREDAAPPSTDHVPEGESAPAPEPAESDSTQDSGQAPEEPAGSVASAEEDTSSDSADTGSDSPEDTGQKENSSAPKNGPDDDPGTNREPRSFPKMDIDETRRIEAPFETRYFAVLIDADGAISNINLEHIAAIEEDVAAEYALTVQYNGRMKGYASSYQYLAEVQEDGGLLVIFVDCSSSLSEANQLLVASGLVGAAALALMFALVWLLSGRAVSPVVESLEKQKRFISDAGHELKTPITVISANVAVLEMTGVQNEWTDSIRSQTRRMTDLVNNLLTLSRMEEDAAPVQFTDVDFSSLVRETAASFDAVAQAEGLDYNVAVQEGLHVNGDAGSLRQLCTVLLDNAMKYAGRRGSIYVLLKADRREGGIRGKKPPRIILEVANTCDSIPEGNLDRLFDRFYRADTSRSRSTGTRRPRPSAAGYRSNGPTEEEFYTGQIPKITVEAPADQGTPAQAGSGAASASGKSSAASAGGDTDHRSRESRGESRPKGGFGIGLSVAKAVAVSHGGSIAASTDGDHLIRFRVTLPMKK